MMFFAALICILMGFIAGIVDADLLFNSTTWFIASIAFSVLPGFSGFTLVRKAE